MLPPAHMGSSAHGQQACRAVTTVILCNTCHSHLLLSLLPSSPPLLPSPPPLTSSPCPQVLALGLPRLALLHSSSALDTVVLQASSLWGYRLCHGLYHTLLPPALTCSHLLAPATTAASAKLLLR
ncbi:unnamed protein product [Closterium sp. NIES-53]